MPSLLELGQFSTHQTGRIVGEPTKFNHPMLGYTKGEIPEMKIICQSRLQ